MELWWWIIPLLETGLISLIIAGVIILLFTQFIDCDSDIPFIVALIFALPLWMGILAVIINFLWLAMASIWGPYF